MLFQKVRHVRTTYRKSKCVLQGTNVKYLQDFYIAQRCTLCFLMPTDPHVNIQNFYIAPFLLIF